MAPTQRPPASGRGDRLAAAAVRILVHRLANTSQHLTALAAIARGGQTELFERQAEHLARTARDVDDDGLAFALVARALGADVPPDRGGARAADIAIDLAREAARGTGREIARAAGDMSRLRGAHVGWLVACFLFDGATTLPRGGVLAWSIEEGQPELVVRASCAVPAGWIDGDLQGARVDAIGEECALVFASP